MIVVAITAGLFIATLVLDCVIHARRKRAEFDRRWNERNGK